MDSGNREALAEFLLRLRSNGITEIHVTEAYARGQMPIECGQSMTAVSMVAKVLSALEVDSTHRVLELGTGTGYQAACRAWCVRSYYFQLCFSRNSKVIHRKLGR